MIVDLDALFAPLGAARFFAEHYERAPLHLAGGARGPLLSHEGLLAALAGVSCVPEGVVVFPDHAGVPAAELLADPARLGAYLEAGHPLVWNRAHGVSSEVDGLTALLAETFAAHVWPNVYATGEAGTPFGTHFDAHEVIAIQCEGRKEWRISEVRVDRPLDAAEMEPAVRAALVHRRAEAEARPLAAFTAAPGDLVYVPRGQFHGAAAVGGRSLHVTFGIQLPTGFDAARKLVLDLLADPRMREMLPPAAADPDGAAAAALVVEITARLADALAAGGLAAAIREIRAGFRAGAGRLHQRG